MILLPSVAVSAYDARDVNAPMIRLSPISKAPTIDGVLKPGEWDGAASTNVFHELLKQNVITPLSKVMIGYDDKNIYVAAEMPVVNGGPPSAIQRNRDGDIYRDDALEIFLDPQHDNSTSYQFVSNALGCFSDMKNGDMAWNGDWKVATSSSNGVWYAEVCIPFSTIGIKLSGDETVVGFNIGLDRKNPDGSYTWAPLLLNGTFHQPGKFGHLVLAKNNGSLSCLLVPSESQIAFDVSTGNNPGPVDCTLKLTLNGLNVGETKSSVIGSKRIVVDFPTKDGVIPDGEYQWEITATNPGDGSVAYRHAGSKTIKRSASIALRKYFLQGKLGVDVDMPVTVDNIRSFNVTASICDKSGKEIMSQTKQDVEKNTKFDFDISKLPCVEHKAVVTVKAPDGKVISTVEQPYTRPEIPAWLGSKAGISDKVLAPWTPLKTKQSKGKINVSLWGRSYTFAGTPFPSSVITQNATILNGPIMMSMVVDGKPISLKGDMKVTKSSESQIIMDGVAQVGSMTANSQVILDFDGNAYVNLRFNGNKAVQIDKFSIEIPIKKQYARYHSYFPTPFASTANSRAIPADGWESGFVSYLWVGNEDKGLALYTTSDQYWTLDSKVMPASVRPFGRDSMKMAFNIISKPETFTADQLKDGIKFQFGFEATPVKKPEKDTWDYRIVHCGDYGLEDSTISDSASLVYDVSNLIAGNKGTLDMMVKVNFDPNVAIADGVDRGRYNRNFLTIGNGQDTMTLYWNIDVRGMRYYFYTRGDIPLMGDARCDWKQGEIHHLSLTWNDKVRLYVDGKLMVENAWLGLMGSCTPATTMSFTMDNPGFGLDEVRLSNIERVPELPTAAYTQDSNTTLLDHLDKVQSSSPQRADTIPAVGNAGYLTGAYILDDWKFGKGIDVIEKSAPALDYLKSLGYKTIVFHEHWTDVQNYPEAVGHEQQLKKLVKACHEKGFQILVYFGYEMADNCPTWLDYKDECLVAPTWQSYTRSNPVQKDYVVCYNSAWQDFIADGVDKLIDKYDIDGVYLDSTAIPWWCNNTYHGCGYTKPDGSLGSTFAYRGSRDMLRRLYTVVKSKKPDGQVNLHNSGHVPVQTIGWATSTWDGEHLTVIPGKHDIDEIIPLDAFRAEFMGRPFGVPAEFLCYDNPYTFHEAFTMTLLHDVLVRSRGYAMSEESRIFKAMDAFGKKGSEFHPYWSNADIATVTGEKAYTSLYVRKGKGVMCVVSSFIKNPQEVSVKLNLGKMKLPKTVTAVNTTTGEQLPMVNGVFKVNLSGVDYALVWVK